MTRICTYRNIVPMKPFDLTILLHLARDRTGGLVVLLHRFGDRSWTHPIWLLFTKQVENLLARSTATDLFGVADQCPQCRRGVKAQGQLLLAFDIASGDKERRRHLPALAFQDERPIDG